MRLIHAIDGGTDEHIVVLTTNDTDDAVTIIERDTYHHESRLWAVLDDLHLQPTPVLNLTQQDLHEWPIGRGLPTDTPLISDLR